MPRHHVALARCGLAPRAFLVGASSKPCQNLSIWLRLNVAMPKTWTKFWCLFQSHTKT